ncbi:linker for activation of T-cells family member 1 [Hoplias malabaricus]|uniref:linker for activation of T-cells family member 1 n=1 Tax=Hoplias malabaricus TaxID=27720 RepID=UPI003461DA8C
MDSTAVLSVVGTAVILSIIILTTLCLNCKGNSQTKFITQHYPPSDLNPGFTVVRTYGENMSGSLITPTSPQVLIPSMADPRRISVCPSDGESQTDYVNQEGEEKNENGYEFPPDKNQEMPDYLDVLPDDTCQSLPSLASSANSGQNYENVIEKPESDEEESDTESQEYINVDCKGPGILTPGLIVGSYDSNSSDNPDGSDYVNAPNQGNLHLII